MRTDSYLFEFVCKSGQVRTVHLRIEDEQDMYHMIAIEKLLQAYINTDDRSIFVDAKALFDLREQITEPSDMSWNRAWHDVMHSLCIFTPGVELGPFPLDIIETYTINYFDHQGIKSIVTITLAETA